jgi:hypothetical protein
MASGDRFTTEVAVAFGDLVEPLADATTSRDGMVALLGDLGWASKPGADPTTVGSVMTLAAATGQLAAAIAQGSSGATAVRAAIPEILQAVRDLEHSSGPAPFDEASFRSSFPKDLLEFLFARYLQHHQPKLYGPLRLIGVLRVEEQPAQGARGAYVRRWVDLERLGAAIREPGNIAGDVYGWGGTFKAAELLGAIVELAGAYGIGAWLEPLDSTVWKSPPPDARALRLPLWTAFVDSGDVLACVALDLVTAPLPAEDAETASLVGLELYPELTGSVGVSQELAPGVMLTIGGSLDAKRAVRLQLRPSGAKVDGKLPQEASVRVAVEARPGQPYLLFGVRDGTRLEIARAHAALTLTERSGAIEAGLEVVLDKASATLALSEADGFLKSVLGAEPRTVDLSAGVRWSSRTGLSFDGRPRPEVDVPLHIDLAGVLTVDEGHVALTAATGGAALEVSVDGALSLGPVRVDVSRLGVRARFVQAPEHDGSLGNYDLSFALKGPDGLGLTVDAPGVTGGGYLFPDGDRYVGAVQLQFSGLSLAAVGLLTTDEHGYSLLVLISVHFPPVQLGFGLALTGVGGLIAINRTVDVPALRAGLQGGSLDAVLFPADVAKDARRAASDLERFFPPAADQYVVGPTVELSWGEGGIVTAALGLFIEFPRPARVVLAGRLRMQLPRPSSAVVDVQLDVLGSLDLSARELAVDAVLRNSRVAAFGLSGQAALRARWGEAPVFLLAIGGFNPRFTPPAGFPKLERVTLALADSANPRLRLSAYLALTANTLQFGATLDVHAAAETAVGNFAVDGHLGFDALIDFAPFGFVVDVDGTVALTWDGSPLMAIALHVTLSGPQPWDVRGTATLQFLGTHSISFALTLGQPRLKDLPAPIDLEAALLQELAAVANWSAQPTASTGALVTLAPSATAARDSLLAYPLSSLTVKQRLAPLDVDITHVGSRRISGAKRFTLKAAGPLTPVNDAFAAAQFLDLSPDQKLLRPSFEPMVAGAQLSTPAPAVPDAISWQERTIAVQTIQLARGGAATAGEPRPLSAGELVSQGLGAAGALNGPANQGAAAYERPGDPLTALLTPGFTVVDGHTLEPFGKPRSSFAAAAELRDGRPELEIIRSRPVSAVGR